MSALANVIQMFQPLCSAQAITNPMYLNRAYAARFGGKALTGGSYDRVVEAEQIRKDFLEGCSDQEIARQVAVLLSKTNVWLKVGRLGLKKFEIKSTAILTEIPRMELLLSIVKAKPAVYTNEEIDMMSREATRILNLHIDLISGNF